MKTIIQLVTLLTCIFSIKAQESDNKQNNVDNLYREDQFYAGLAHTILVDTPSGFVNDAISPYISAGFIRDFPTNVNRDQAFGIGLGFSYENIKSNFAAINPLNNKYEIVENYQKNTLSNYYIEIPLEYRWRTSTAHTHKFWRIYTGFRYAYLVHSKSNYIGDYGEYIFRNDPNIAKQHLKIYFAFGYNTWNFFTTYRVTPLYKGEISYKTPFHSLQFGVMFYIL